MSEYQENSSKFLLSSASFENGDSLDDGGDEIFYEKIEAPKFVDFTAPNHYCPDDRYWFCQRVGCTQKHEEEMDSEEIYKNFVLRVMAARSPNVRLRKALERNCSRTPIKCPLSAPQKPSRPRLTRTALISSFSKKMVDDKKRVVKKPVLKSGSTPLTKTKPVAAKYLTTPRNKKTTSDQNLFRSVRNPKPVNVEVEKSRVVAKALVFSPKKAIKVKTSVELRTPISKLCQGMNKLELSSQKKRTLGCSSKSSKNSSNSLSRSSRKVQRKPEEPKSSQIRTNREAKSGNSIKTKIKGQLSEKASKKLVGGLKNNEGSDTKHQLAKNIIEESGLKESSHEDSDLATLDSSKIDANCLDVEQSNTSRSQATNSEENNDKDGNGNMTSESCGDHLNANRSCEGQRDGHEFMDGEDKENAPASDGNRIHNTNLKQNGRTIFGLHDKYGQVKKKVTHQAQSKNLKEGSSGPVTKLKKPKATNPKPFRLRTDERCILKEAILERRTDSLIPHSEIANVSTPTPGGKLQKKQGSDIHQKGNISIGLKTPKEQERSSKAESKERKKLSFPHESSAMQRLEKFRKITSSSPLPKQSVLVKPQGVVPVPVPTKQQEMAPYLIPGLKLEVIHEISPELVLSEHKTRSCIKKLK